MTARSTSDNNSAVGTLFIQPDSTTSLYYILNVVDLPSIQGFPPVGSKDFNNSAYVFDNGSLSPDNKTLTYTYTYNSGIVNPMPDDIGDSSTFQTVALPFFQDADGTVFGSLTTVVVQAADSTPPASAPPPKQGTVSNIKIAHDTVGLGTTTGQSSLRFPNLIRLNATPATFTDGAIMAFTIESATMPANYYIVGAVYNNDGNNYDMQLNFNEWNYGIYQSGDNGNPQITTSAIFTQVQSNQLNLSSWLIGISSYLTPKNKYYVAESNSDPGADIYTPTIAWLQAYPYPNITVSSPYGYGNAIQL